MTTARELDERYGRTRRGRLRWVIVAVVSVALVSVAAWVTIARSMDTVDIVDLGYEVVDEHSVTVRFQISGVQGKEIACALKALDEEFGIVGWKIVEIQAADTLLQQFSATVPTVSEATTGLVNSCWVAP